MKITKAVRHALPLQIALYAPTSGGKTFSALKFAAGLIPPGGKIVIVDTERGRASLYADNKKILADLPNGFDVVDLDPPYHPQRYIEAIDLCEKSSYAVCIIDSGSDSWDGPGGCTDIAEADNERWNKAKLWNKRMMSRASLSTMHIIWCLKAQDKTKIIAKEKSAKGKQEYIELGMLPIWEKNNLFPQLLVFAVDPITHLSTAVKVHDDLAELFAQPRLITKQDGERVRLWNESGKAVSPVEQLHKRARVAADSGFEAYRAFYAALSTGQKAALKDIHEELKLLADQVDATAQPQGELAAVGD